MMGVLLPLAGLLGIEVDELAERFKRNAIAWTALAFFALIGVVFLLAALNAWLTEHWGPVLAPLAMAGGALFIALAIYVTIATMANVARQREVERKRSADKTALVTTAAITALPLVLQSDLVKKVGIPVGGALAAAFLLSKPGPRRNGHDTTGRH